jgi:hypothetical protein
VGYLKGRFSSLRGLRQQIDDAIDHERAIAWVRTCIIIHALVHQIERGNEDEDWIVELVEDGITSSDNMELDSQTDEATQAASGQEKREWLRDMLLEAIN